MILRALAALAGVLVVTGGLAASPMPWLAPIWFGVCLLAFGLLTEPGKGAK